MIRKVIFIGYQPLTEKVKNDFYLDKLADLGYIVEFWDLTKIFFPQTDYGRFKNTYSLNIDKISDLDELLANTDTFTTFFIIIITYEYRVVKLFRLLTKFNCRISFFARGMVPLPTFEKQKINVLIMLSKVFKFKVLLQYVNNRKAYWLKKIGFIKPYDVLFNAGELGICTVGLAYEVEKRKSKFVQISSFDFDRFIIMQNCQRVIEEKYCVFMDEYLPFHPDFNLLGIRTIDSKDYYITLNNFFDLIEEKFHLKVVIAAHPKAYNYRTENPFFERQIFYNKAAELTKFAEFSIAHASTSVSFSVLNRKPVIFLYNNNIKTIMTYYYEFISNFSKTLGSPLINTDDYNFDEIHIPVINEMRYSEYKYKFLTSPESENLCSSETFINAISQL